MSVLNEEPWDQAGSLELVQEKYQQVFSGNYCPMKREVSLCNQVNREAMVSDWVFDGLIKAELKLQGLAQISKTQMTKELPIV